MTIVISVKVNDGIVLAADSVTSFFDGDGKVAKTYDYANKVTNLVKVWPIGSMTYGSGGIGNASIATVSKDLRRQLDPRTSTDKALALDQASYTVREVAEKSRDYLFSEFTKAYGDSPPAGFYLGYRVCGYSAGAALPEAWEVGISGADAFGPDAIYPDKEHGRPAFGPRWAGEPEALDRLILGVSSRAVDGFMHLGLDPGPAAETVHELRSALYQPLYHPAMPIQDAIDLARFLAETAAGFSRFSMRTATVGGPIEVATITKHEGFRWVARKHFYSDEYNRETGNEA